MAGAWDILNLGAILLGRNLEDFPTLERKAVRVIQYPGEGRAETTREQMGSKGYAAGFEGLIDYINTLLPRNEVIGKALRETEALFPEIAIRELVANMLIHQDFSISGTGPIVEIFSDRIEISNPGESLIATDRFVDAPPQSRNETMAALMRRFGICEERGSGIDKVILAIEFSQMPAPLFETSSRCDTLGDIRVQECEGYEQGRKDKGCLSSCLPASCHARENYQRDAAPAVRH